MSLRKFLKAFTPLKTFITVERRPTDLNLLLTQEFQCFQYTKCSLWWRQSERNYNEDDYGWVNFRKCSCFQTSHASMISYAFKELKREKTTINFSSPFVQWMMRKISKIIPANYEWKTLENRVNWWGLWHAFQGATCGETSSSIISFILAFPWSLWEKRRTFGKMQNFKSIQNC